MVIRLHSNIISRWQMRLIFIPISSPVMPHFFPYLIFWDGHHLFFNQTTNRTAYVVFTCTPCSLYSSKARWRTKLWPSPAEMQCWWKRREMRNQASPNHQPYWQGECQLQPPKILMVKWKKTVSPVCLCLSLWGWGVGVDEGCTVVI